MDIKKYITNKDITITNDDIDIDKLTNDLRKGYELSSEVDSKIKTAVDEANKTSKSAFDDLQGRYDDIEKRNTDLADRVKKVSLERTMVEYGFNKTQFDEVSKMRSSLFGEESDDDKAISQIKEKFKDTYFPTPKEEPPKQKDDIPLGNSVPEPKEIKATRTTPIKNLFK
jgi:predicted  nucleic acid-binding Zn-ribbon protein